MGASTERPRPNPKPPELDGTEAQLQELLAIERERLMVAVRIEKERSIVFPETTVIIHDVWKLLSELEARKRRRR